MGFIVIVAGIIFFIHLSFVLLVYGPLLPHWYAVLILFVYHLLFFNLMIAFYMSVMTDPGLVPRSWGFYMGDETKRRRYCKMCNVWKPDRTHHCSICNRCILNMDHHCPWINNCVGFYNRKFFMQLLAFVFMTLAVVVITSVHEVVHRVIKLVTQNVFSLTYFLTSAIIACAIGMALLLLMTLTNFIRFHVKLVLDNYTTIENLEREDGAKSKFDIGRRRNWEQVFGSNMWLWWFPMHTQASRPIGDGVRWRVHYTRVIDEDEELPADQDGSASQTSRLLQQGNSAASTNRSGASGQR